MPHLGPAVRVVDYGIRVKFMAKPHEDTFHQLDRNMIRGCFLACTPTYELESKLLVSP